jgi:tight adherence protein C
MSPVLLGLLFGTAATLTILGLFRGNRTQRLSRRVEQMSGGERAEVYDGSFSERIIEPMIRGVVDLVSRLLPIRVIGAVERKLEETGGQMQVSRFMATWIIFAVVWTAVGAPLMLAVLPFLVLLVMLPGWLILGIYLPWLILRRKGQKRIKRIDQDLPDAIDLIITSVESGLGLQAAMMQVTAHLDGPISIEFARASQEVSLGRSRSEALQGMGDRNGSRELRLFVRAINEAEQMGISVAQVLRNQSGEMRERRRQKAREKANMIPVKITIPTVLFIFPTLFLLILGPVALQVLDFFSER